MYAAAALEVDDSQPVNPRRQVRGSSRRTRERPEFGTYGGSMLPQEARRRAFGRFVREALRDAKSRGMTVTDVEKATGVGSSTFYRWRDGDWSKDPRTSQVIGFCTGLDIPQSAAFKALGWAGGDRQDTAPEPLVDPDLRLIQRRLVDPNVSDDQKSAIRSMLRLIAGQSSSRGRAVSG